MTSETDISEGWTESDSRHFLDVGAIHTPHRDEIGGVIADLVPASPGERVQIVDIGIGGGWLSELLKQRFPAAQILGLDGSHTMLVEAQRRLAPFGDRVQLRPFRLEDTPWRRDVGEVNCFVSSLVLHHLDGPGKRTLYRDLYERLAPGGALLVADLVAPAGERERDYMARAWDEAVERQSLQLTGSRGVFERFQADRSNVYRYPDPMDVPSTIPEHLTWLGEVGFVSANAFWERAAHAVYGGYKA